MAKWVIDVSTVGEVGFSDVLALRFDYNPELLQVLKDALRARKPQKPSEVGWWSGTFRCWLVTSDNWPKIRRSLLNAGVQLTGPEAFPATRRDRPAT
jgi:hypothetical protein